MLPASGVTGDKRIPTRSLPQMSTMAWVTSSVRRARFSIEPPYRPVRLLVESRRNWSSR
ncbi:hypothetical protein KPSA1_03904 [Pseudomonas syringae pv. actinidiae]|uniref:Uncharacterized protein n=1 Tax=Pseudomonas syringae pv. actinidiae TaxID=103796 RepID=A0A2V0QBN6_PSESF|nr:hypothetical protein KPSA1_03904 [Pseudomonas syringae pv. actinidiae]